MTGTYAAIFLFFLCSLLVSFLWQTKKRLNEVLSSNQKYSSIQKTFSKAVAGIEASLEQEKINSSLLFKVLGSIDDGVAVMDREGLLQYANTALWNHYAISSEDIGRYMGRSWIRLHSEKGQQEINDVVLPALQEKNVWIGESDVLAQDGSWLRAELYISKIEEGYIGFIRDVTDRHRAELDRQQLIVQVHQLQKFDAVERVVRALVHEFNNSLSSIGGFSEMLIEDLPESSPQHGYAERIYHASQQMHGLIEQARLLIPGNKSEPPQASDLLTIVPSVIGDLKKKMPMAFNICEELHVDEARLRCDGLRLTQMLYHVLQNAIETKSDAVFLDIDHYRHSLDNISSTKGEIFHHIERYDKKGLRLHYGQYDPKEIYMQVMVIDRGQGISPDVMEHILDPFFSTKSEDAQTGLGMSIVRSVIRHCEGYLMIDSFPGRGTNVTMMIPALKSGVSDSRSTKAVIQRLAQEMT